MSKNAPCQKVTFTLTSVPRRAAERKTLDRLMRMEPGIVRGMKKLQKKRRMVDNVTTIRAGRKWTSRARVTRITHLVPGATFTISVTPQIEPDLKSVQKYLDASSS